MTATDSLRLRGLGDQPLRAVSMQRCRFGRPVSGSKYASRSMCSAAAALRRMYSSRRGSSAQFTGFEMKSVAPASKARRMASESSCPVTMTIGTVAKRGSARRRRQTS